MSMLFTTVHHMLTTPGCSVVLHFSNIFFFQFIYIYRIWWRYARQRPPVSTAISAAISAASCFPLHKSSNTKVFSVHKVVACFLWQPCCVYIHQDFAHSPAVGFLSSPIDHVKVQTAMNRATNLDLKEGVKQLHLKSMWKKKLRKLITKCYFIIHFTDDRI